MNASDTIFAVSSGSGVAGITVIRVTGPGASNAVMSLCSAMPLARRVALRELRDGRGELVDHAVVLWLPGPGTATGEDMAEFHVHGSSAVVGAVMVALSALPGFRLAEAGEFSRRAFGNGCIDLVEAEGLADLLVAQTDEQRRQAMYQMAGFASSTYDSWLKRMTSVLARLEAAIDFIDEEDVAEQSLRLVRPETDTLISELERAVAGAARADIVRGGVRIAIIGAPNVGKSSLLNCLANRDAAIVSPVAGTTRDTIEVTLMLAGLPVTITDTAGLRDGSTDEIELLGMERTRRAASNAHIVLEVYAADGGEVTPAVQDERTMRLLNKSDLELIPLRNEFDLAISAKTGKGIDSLLLALERQIVERFSALEAPVVVRERHKSALQESIRHLNDSVKVGSESLELAAEHVRAAAVSLGRITGKVGVEDVLGQIFAEFCIGK